MRITVMVSAVTIVLVSTIGTVSADEFTAIRDVKPLTTLNGVKAVPMSSVELNAVKGMDHHFLVNTPGQGIIDPPASVNAAPLAAPQPGRFGTDFNHDGDEANFVDITATQNAAPSYLGFRNASCNGVIMVAGFATCL
jgi:hypothetical protein